VSARVIHAVEKRAAIVSLVNVRAVRVDGAPVRSERTAADRVRSSIDRVLNETAICACATVDREGRAHVNTAYFAFSDALDLYFLSHPGSRHSQNLAANPSMAVAVFASAQNWTDPGRGIQLFGTGEQVTGAVAREGEQVYGRRFHAYAEWKGTLKADDPALDYSFYRFVPDRVKILDEEAFGDAVFIEAAIARRRD
jgi:uncharacterized protein YhbP (UPF0306 family)